MATTFVEVTPHSSNNQLSSRIFVPVAVGAVTAGLLGGLLHGGEHPCRPATELCGEINKAWLPDEPAQKDPAGPLGGLRITTAIASSTITPTNLVLPTTFK